MLFITVVGYVFFAFLCLYPCYPCHPWFVFLRSLNGPGEKIGGLRNKIMILGS